MSLAQGAQSVINWKQEAAYGAAPSGNWNELSFSSETLGQTVNPLVSDEIRRDATVPAMRGGNINNAGNIVTDFSPTRFGTFLGHLLRGSAGFTSAAIVPSALANTTAYLRGDVVSHAGNLYICKNSGTSSGAAALTSTDFSDETTGTATFQYVSAAATTQYRHLLNAGARFPTHGIAFEKGVLGGSVDHYERYLGGRIDSLNLTIPQEAILKATWNFLFSGNAVNASTSAAGTPVAIAEDPFTGADVAIELNGVESAVARDGSIVIPNNVQGDTFRAGSRVRREPNPARREPNGNLTVYFENETEWNLFKNETKFSLMFSMLLKGKLLSLEFPECKIFGDPSPKIGGAGNIMVTFNWHAFRQSGSYDCQLILKNTNATVTV